MQLLQLVHGRRDARLRESQHARRAPGARRRRLRGPARRPRARQGVPIPAATRTPAADGARSPDARAAPRSAEAADASRERPGSATPPGSSPSTRRRPTSSEGSTSACSTGPLMEAFAVVRGARPGADRDSTEELLAGLGFADPATAYDSVRTAGRPGARGSGRCSATQFPVIGARARLAADAALALARLGARADALRDRTGRRRRARRRPDAARRLAALTGASSRSPRARRATRSGQFALPGSAPDHPLYPAGRGRPGPRRRGVRGPGGRGPRHRPGCWSIVAARCSRGPSPGGPSRCRSRWSASARLGAEELTFASDLDVVFVYEERGRRTSARPAARPSG